MRSRQANGQPRKACDGWHAGKLATCQCLNSPGHPGDTNNLLKYDADLVDLLRSAADFLRLESDESESWTLNRIELSQTLLHNGFCVPAQIALISDADLQASNCSLGGMAGDFVRSQRSLRSASFTSSTLRPAKRCCCISSSSLQDEWLPADQLMTALARINFCLASSSIIMLLGKHSPELDPIMLTKAAHASEAKATRAAEANIKVPSSKLTTSQTSVLVHACIDQADSVQS